MKQNLRAWPLRCVQPWINASLGTVLRPGEAQFGNKPNQLFRSYLLNYLTLLFAGVLWSSGGVVRAQATLPASGTYTQTFDGIGSGLPTGWTVRTGATSSTLGTPQSLTTAQTSWATTTGAFANYASADNLVATSNATAQSGSSDRALGVRQTGSFGDPSAAFTFQIQNTLNTSNVQLQFKLQNLDATSSSGRTVNWQVQYGLGSSPITFTTLPTSPSNLTVTLGTPNSNFTNTLVSVNFGNTLDNQSGNVWIRIVALSSSLGSGSRPITGIDDFILTYLTLPTITITPSSLTGNSGLVYTEGGSASAPISVSATSLTGVPGSVTVTTSDGTNFAVSSDGSTFASSATLPYSTSTLSATTITVRLNSGLAIGATYATTLTFAGGGATATVPVTGTVLADNTPFLTATPTSLTGFSTTVGTPSTAKTYALSAINLTGNVSISASTGYEISFDGTIYASSTTVAPTSGSVNQTFFVRLTGASTGTFNGTITNSSTGLTATVALSGTVVPPPSLSVSPATLNGFTTVEGIASATQRFTVSATSLPAALTITAPTGVSISVNGTTFVSSLTLAQSTISTTLVARLSGEIAGPINGTITAVSGSLSALVAVIGTVSAAPPVVYHYLGGGNFTQNWSNTGLITTDDIWYNVPSIRGYRGDDLTTGTGIDPQTLTEGTNGYVAEVIANQTNTGNTSGGIAEFEITNPVIALQGSGTADAPFLQIHLNTTGVTSVSVSYNLRDVDGTTDNSIQPVALQYRVGTTGDFINVPAAFVADASTGPSSATQVTAVNIILPVGAENNSRVQLRIMTSNAVGSDEWIGIDDIVIAGTSTGPVTPGLSIDNVSIVEGNSGTKEILFTVNSSIPAPAGGITFDIATADGSATAGSDYVSKTLTSQTIPSGNDTYTFNVVINGDLLPEASESFSVVISNLVGATLVNAQALGTIVNDDAVPVQIHDIQGPGHVSPYVSQPVVTTGIVTAIRGSGFYIQDTNPDANDLTSEGILVFTSTPPTGIEVGAIVSVTGTVDEFRAGGNTSLGITEISTPTYITLSVGNALPTPILLSAAAGPGVRKIPTERIYNDSSNPNSDVEATAFDPIDDGIDFYETLEGMLVQINNPITLSFGSSAEELWVLPDNGNGATVRNLRGGVTISGNDETNINTAIANSDFNPEKIQIDDSLNDVSITVPTNLPVGTVLNTIQGIVSYSSSNYEVLTLASPTVAIASPLTKEVTTLNPQTNQLTIATFNVENLDLGDGNLKFNSLANAMVTNLSAPDILVIEEIQDDSGPTNNGVVSAALTSQSLISAISAVGGPTYQYREIAPVDGTNGGEPGGNIRVGFLFNAARVSFVDRPGGTSTGSVSVNNVSGSPQLSFSPGLIDPTNSTFSGSRKPLVGEFLFNGQTVFVIGNHFTSRGGSGSLFDRFQPPAQGGQSARETQALVVNNFIDQLLAVNPMANIAVMGDFNEFQFFPALQILKGNVSGQSPVLTSLITTLPVGERYTYYFDGNAQALDHFLVSNGLLNKLDQFDVVHINSEFPDQISDHDPSLARFTILPISATLVASTSAVCPASPVTLSATVAGLAGATYALTITNGTDQTTASGLSASAVTATLTPTVPGAFTLTVLTSTNMTTSAVSGSVTINSVPTNASLTSGTLTCSPTSVTLTASATGTTGYTFSAGAAQIGTTNLAVVTTEGTYTVTVSNVTGCTASATATVSSNTLVPTSTLIANGTITCSNASATLTAGGGTSYTLSNGQSNTTGSFTVSSGGTYTVTVANASGCTASTTATVQSTTTAPSAPTYTLTNNGTVCAGTPLIVTANGCPSGTVSFTINPTTPSGLAVSPSYTFNGNTPAGTYTICAICTIGSCSSPMAITTITISSTAVTLTASSTVICSGSSVTLTASGGTSYAFSTGAVQIGSTNQAVVSQSGTYSVTVTNANGCTSVASLSIGQTASGISLGSPASASTVCAGSSIQVPVAASGAINSYQWYKNGSQVTGQTSATLSLGNIQLGDAGSYSLVVTGACGSMTSTAFVLTVNPQPTITLTFPGGTVVSPTGLPTIQLPTPGQVLVQASGGTSYNWTLVVDRINGYEVRQTANNTSGLFTINKPGPYQVTVTGANGCSRTVSGLIVN